MMAVQQSSLQVNAVPNANARAVFVMKLFATWLIVCQGITQIMQDLEVAAKINANQAKAKFVAQHNANQD